MLTDADEPESYEVAQGSEHWEQWQRAMQEEMDSLRHNHTYDLVAMPKERNILRNKWDYKVKAKEKSSQPIYQARLVVKGFTQKKEVDFDEIFSLGVKMTSIRTVLGLAASMNLEVEQLVVGNVDVVEDDDDEESRGSSSQTSSHVLRN